jgi:hypothetical protein
MLRRALKIAVMAGALGAVQAQASDYLLYWQVDDTAAITWFDGTELGTVSDYTNRDGQQINMARAVSTGSPDGMYTYYMDIGVTSDTMEPTGDGAGTGPMLSYIGAFDSSTSLAGWSFAIELGNWANGQWTTLATTGMISYNDLTVQSAAEGGAYILTADQGYNLPNFIAWTPQSYMVPEPSSGLLVLIGASLLALRRRRS